MKNGKYFVGILVLVGVLFNLFSKSYALHPDTHQNLNRFIANHTILGFSLDSFLRSQLGFSNGKMENLNSNEVWEWLRDGGKYEDKPPSSIIPFLRSFNHFHNPLTNEGLKGSWSSSIQWSQAPKGTQTPHGYYSWNDVRDYFYNALKAENKKERDDNFADTFRGLGQLMHLVQDMSVPSHTRDDIHIFYNYETWVSQEIDYEMVSTYDNISLDPTVIGNPSTLAPVPVANLFDTEIYMGENPEDTLRSDIGLSEYANANFLSLDTMFTTDTFPYPACTSVELTDYEITDPKDPSRKVLREYQKKIADGETGYRLATASVFEYCFDPNSSEWKLVHEAATLDNEIYKEYSQRLIPRAIGYSAGLLNYFFRGKLQASALPIFLDNSIYAIFLNVKNITPSEEQMNNGIFTVVVRYTPVGGNPDGSDDIFIRSNDVESGTLQYGEATDVLFYLSRSVPLDSYGSITCMLAYRGRLGNEENCVIGKSFSLGDIRFNEEWDNGLDGKYPWIHTVPDENPDNGTTSNAVDNGLLLKDNLRFMGYKSPRFNSSHLDLVDADHPNGLMVTAETCLQFKIDELSINAQPPSAEGTTAAWQYLSFEFNNGLSLQFSVEGQGVYWDSNTAYCGFSFGHIMALNVHTLFQNCGIPIPEPFFLESINLTQQLWNLTEASTVEHHQHMEVDFIRVVERYMEPE